MSAWLFLSSLTATAVSWALLHGVGLTSLPVRYAIATAAGWAMLTGCVVVWRRRQSRRAAHREAASDGLLDGVEAAADLAQAVGRGGSRTASPTFGGGGGFSGGGGGSSWGQALDAKAGLVADGSAAARLAASPISRANAAGGSSRGGVGDLVSGLGDADEALPVLLIVVLGAVLLSALLAAGALVVGAPALLGEVLLEAALLAPVMRSVRRDLDAEPDDGRVAALVLGHTWKPMLTIGLTLILGGAIAQQICPTSRSVRDLVRAIQTPARCAPPTSASPSATTP